MNQAQIESLLRILLMVGGGIAVGRGYLTDVQLSDLVNKVLAVAGPIAALAAAGWGLYTRRRDGIIQAATEQKDVIVQTDPTTANVTFASNPKVVATPVVSVTPQMSKG